jgi:glycosyltransferase involved in cell wall biosynthesis
MVWPDEIKRVKSTPFVSIVTPTYNRRQFIPWLIRCVEHQTYPREYTEWVIYDDGSDSIYDIIEPFISTLNIRYIRGDIKLNVGAKRNALNAAARGDIIVTMDDDDYYPPERISHAVQMLQLRKCEIAGSTRLNLYYTDDGSIWEVGPYNSKHATFGTMAYTKRYAETHKCDESVVYAEEAAFTSNYSEPMAQLDPNKVMLVICHNDNTFSKDGIRKGGENPVVKKTGMKIRAFIKNADLRNFYKST